MVHAALALVIAQDGTHVKLRMPRLNDPRPIVPRYGGLRCLHRYAHPGAPIICWAVYMALTLDIYCDINVRSAPTGKKAPVEVSTGYVWRGPDWAPLASEPVWGTWDLRRWWEACRAPIRARAFDDGLTNEYGGSREVVSSKVETVKVGRSVALRSILASGLIAEEKPA